jgi:hypothetical protein
MRAVRSTSEARFFVLTTAQLSMPNNPTEPSAQDGTGKLEHVLLQAVRGSGPQRPVRTLLEFIAVPARSCPPLAVIAVAMAGSDGKFVAMLLVALMTVLVSVAAWDQWVVVPAERRRARSRRRGHGCKAASRRPRDGSAH